MTWDNKKTDEKYVLLSMGSRPSDASEIGS